MKSKFAVGVLKLLSGSVVTQLFQVISIPVVASIYGPEAMAGYGYMLVLISIAAPIVTLKLDLILFNLNNRLLVESVLCASVFIPLISCIFVSILWMIELCVDIKIPADYIDMILCIAFGNLSQLILNSLLKNEKYAIFNYLNILRIVAFFIFALIFKANNNGLLLALWLSYAAIYLFGMPFMTSLSFLKGIKFNRLCARVKINKIKNGHNLLPSIFQGLLNSASHGMPVFFATSYFNGDQAGKFILVERLIRAPSVMLNNSLRSVALNNFQKSNRKILINTKIIIFVFYGVVFLFLWGVGNFLDEYLSETKWSGVGVFVAPVLIWSFGFVFNSIGSAFIIKFGDFNWLFKLQIIDVLLKLFFMIYYSAYELSFMGLIYSHVIVSVLFNLFVAHRGWYLYNIGGNSRG